MFDFTLLISFFFIIPSLFILSIILTRKSTLSFKNIIIEIIIAFIITLSTAYIIKGEYNFYVGGPTAVGLGYPYYYRFLEVRPFQLILPGSDKSIENKVNINNYENKIDMSIIITSFINFCFNMVFWFFITSIIYFIYRKLYISLERK